MSLPLRQTIRFHAPLTGVEASVVTLPSAPVPEPEPVDLTPPVELPPEDQADELAAMRALLAEVASQCGRLSQQWEQDRRDLQDLAVELAVTVGEHLLGRRGDRETWPLEPWVTRAIQRLGLDHPLQVRLHPEDRLELEKLAPPEELEVLFAQVQVVASDEVPRGGCVVMKGDEGLILDHAARLETIRETLLRGLDDARFECAPVETPASTVS